MKKIILIFILCLFVSLAGCQLTDNNGNTVEVSNQAKMGEALDSLFEGVDVANVTSNLNFITSKDGITISYSSSNEAVISNTGEIHPTDKDETVVITITLALNGETKTSTIVVIVKADANYGGNGDDPNQGNTGDDPNQGNTGDDPNQGNTGDDPNQGNTGDDPNQGGNGDDPNQGGNGDDPNQGGNGDDPNQGGNGDDPNQGGNGDDPNQGGNGDDPSQGGNGDDPNQGGEEETEPDQALVEALGNTDLSNVKITEIYLVDGEQLYQSIYSINGLLVHFEGESESDGTMYHDHAYVTFDEEGYVVEIRYSEGEDPYSLLVSDDDIEYFFYYCYFYLDTYDFTALDAADFVLVEENHYQVKASKLNEVAFAILGDYNDEETVQTYKSFDLYLKDGKLFKIVAEDSMQGTYMGEAYEQVDKLTLLFEEYGSQEFELPEAEENPVSDGSIASVYSLNKGDEVEVSGYVAGYSKGYLYILDDTASIVIYKSNQDFGSFEVGGYVYVSGTVDIYNGLVEIKINSLSDIVYDDEELAEISKYEINSLSDITEDLMSEVLDINSVTVKSITMPGDKDGSIVLVDSEENELTLFLKKAMKDLAEELFANTNVGDVISLKNIAVGYYKNNVQLLLTNQTELSALKGLFLSFTRLVVDINTETEDLFADLEVSYYSNEGKQILTKEDYQIEGEYDLSQAGTYSLKVKYNEEEVSLTLVVRETSVTVAEYETLSVFAQKNDLTCGLPSTGEVHALVIPVIFTNSTMTEAEAKTLLETAINGSKTDTGWHSLNSYYLEVSHGKLDLRGDITSAYYTNEAYDLKIGESGKDDYRYLAGALKALDEEIDYTLYDQNNDGYIDTVYLIYLAPYENGSDLWWAYNYEFYEDADEVVELDGLGIDWYLWMSIEFFNEDIYYYYDEEDKMHTDDLGVTINCETIIHETGHALGLDDYYDYVNKNNYTGGLGGAVMMDYNQGDHDPFSKALLGWINPTMILGADYTGDLRSFAEYGDAIFIANEGNGTYFDEFYVICYYTPTGTNALKADKECGLFGTDGILIYHVNAQLKSDWQKQGSAIYVYEYNNGGNIRLIQIVEADNNNSIDETTYADNSDLFQAGGTLTPNWSNGKSAGFTITVNTIDGVANVTVDFK